MLVYEISCPNLTCTYFNAVPPPVPFTPEDPLDPEEPDDPLAPASPLAPDVPEDPDVPDDPPQIQPSVNVY